MVSQQLASEVGSSFDGISMTVGRMRVQKQVIAAVAATATGDLNTALTASTTTYHFMCLMPRAAKFLGATFRSEAAGVAGATVDLVYAASGTAVGSGTTMITQFAGNAVTAATNYKATVTAANSNLPAGAIVFVKLVTGAAETLKPLIVDLEFQL